MFDPAATMTTIILLLLLHTAAAVATSFTFQGFGRSNTTPPLDLFNHTNITNGLLRLTDTTSYQQLGHAFLRRPLPLKRSSFSTTFVFAIVPNYGSYGADHGMAFVLSSNTLSDALPAENLGLFNPKLRNTSTTWFFAVELDTVKNHEFDDIDNNHVGIDVNDLRSTNSTSLGSLRLTSGQPMQVWVDYTAADSQVSVRLARLHDPMPEPALLRSYVNLSSNLTEKAYVGFSASTGGATASHYVLGWSFSSDGEALPPLDLDRLPRLPPQNNRRRKPSQTVVFSLVIFAMGATILFAGGITYWVRRRRRFAELIEAGELCYGPNRMSYKDLYKATKGFKEENLLGAGGFGHVYKGSLPESRTLVAVKKISHHSSQGVKEFVTEITSMARLRHRNLVQLIGYCRRRGELLLVYDYMVNGSLDRFLHTSSGKNTLSWKQRFHVVRGVAEGLLYLHEGWEQVVIHRDIKASNVLLDADFNGRLGDFGLAKIYDRGGGNQETTRLVGTIGYLAPEMSRTGKATTYTDVYAFGAFLLEVACGRRPMIVPQPQEGAAEKSPPLFLVDWVMEHWRGGDILAAVDPRLDYDYEAAEAERVLKLGVLCSHELPAQRPSMKQVVQVLDGKAEVPVDMPEVESDVEMPTVFAVAAGEAPLASFPSPWERRGSECSSLKVEVDSCKFSV